MEKASLGGKTWAEEEREKQLADEAAEGGSSKRVPLSKGRFGHLREVGERGYVEAVESEERSVWVVVHIYDPVCSFIIPSHWYIKLTGFVVVGQMCIS